MEKRLRANLFNEVTPNEHQSRYGQGANMGRTLGPVIGGPGEGRHRRVRPDFDPARGTNREKAEETSGKR